MKFIEKLIKALLHRHQRVVFMEQRLDHGFDIRVACAKCDTPLSINNKEIIKILKQMKEKRSILEREIEILKNDNHRLVWSKN